MTRGLKFFYLGSRGIIVIILINVGKTKALIRTFVFAYAKIRFFSRHGSYSSYGFCTVHFVSLWFIFVQSLIKISQTRPVFSENCFYMFQLLVYLPEFLHS